MIKRISTLGLLGLFFLTLALVAAGWIIGGNWIAEKVLPITGAISRYLLVASLLSFLPLSLFRKTRQLLGRLLGLTSMAFGLHYSLFGFVITYKYWGFLGAVLGLGLFGFGATFTGFLATLFRGEWSEFGQMCAGIAATWGFRIAGALVLAWAAGSNQPKAPGGKGRSVIIDAEASS